MPNGEYKIPFVAIQLTKKCNLDCKFCFRRKNFKEANKKQLQKVISKIIELDPEKVVLSGGEPILLPHIKEILIQFKEGGIKTILQSNCMQLKEVIYDLDKYLDWYSVSLDGDTEESNKIMRGPKQFTKVLDCLKIIKELNKPVKLGTVVSAQNTNAILGIGNLIQDKVSVWKLYQFYPRKGCAADKNKKKFAISDAKYNKVINSVLKKYPKVNISSHSIKDFSKGPCVLIHPDGDVHLTKGVKDVLIGNLLHSTALEIKSKLKNEGFLDNIIENYVKTYTEVN